MRSASAVVRSLAIAVALHVLLDDVGEVVGLEHVAVGERDAALDAASSSRTLNGQS